MKAKQGPRRFAAMGQFSALDICAFTDNLGPKDAFVHAVQFINKSLESCRKSVFIWGAKPNHPLTQRGAAYDTGSS